MTEISSKNTMDKCKRIVHRDGASSFSKCNALNHTNLQPGDDRAAITQAEVLEHFGVEKEAW